MELVKYSCGCIGLRPLNDFEVDEVCAADLSMRDPTKDLHAGAGTRYGRKSYIIEVCDDHEGRGSAHAAGWRAMTTKPFEPLSVVETVELLGVLVAVAQDGETARGIVRLAKRFMS